jgi:hypothetical protein
MQKEWFINNSNQLNVFRMIISPIFRSTRLCVAACGIMHPRCCRPVTLKRRLPGYRPATSWILYKTSCNTQSSAPEDGQNYRPKHVEMIRLINKPLLLHPIGCLCYLYQWCKVKRISDNEIYLFVKYTKSVLWRVAKRLSLYKGRTVPKG